MAFRNYMEEAVIEELNGVLEQLEGACKSEKCRQDMTAYALNRLPAKVCGYASGRYLYQIAPGESAVKNGYYREAHESGACGEGKPASLMARICADKRTDVHG
ncbi:MAG: late competence development ComFB family protein [Candidatus Omnitrophota bacterium]|nr:late competence development ComFB family protein [Candidatus Omnitrophota bacterium]